MLALPLPMSRVDVVNLPESVAARLAAACLRFVDVELAAARPSALYVRKRYAPLTHQPVCVCWGGGGLCMCANGTPR